MSNWHPIVGAVVFSLLGIVLIVLGFKIFDWLMPRINIEKELAENHNIAVAIVVAAMIIGLSMIIAAVMGAPAT